MYKFSITVLNPNNPDYKRAKKETKKNIMQILASKTEEYLYGLDLNSYDFIKNTGVDTKFCSFEPTELTVYFEEDI